MNQATHKYNSLSRKVIVRFCLFTLVLSLVFGALAFALLYAQEDNIIERGIQNQAQALISAYVKTGQWQQPEQPNMQLHFSKETFPKDIRATAVEEPRRTEFYGEQGRHYHIHRITGDVTHGEELYLVAEVSQQLLVRPVRIGIVTLLAVSGGILALIACFVAWLIARKITKPLTELAYLVDGVAPEQIPDKFAGQFPDNEIGLLARTLEDALSRLNKSLEREKCFTRDVSHELRTPLAVIKNATELQLTQPGLTAQQNEVTKRIRDAAEQMTRTVHTLLTLAREEQTGAEKQLVALMPLVEQSVLDNRLLLEGKNVDVEVDNSCSTQVLALPGMLKVLLDNLLSNAFQYTSAGKVTVRYTDNSLVVADTGPGIEASISDKITDAGVKGQQSAGFGLGLSIVKRLCEHQGWHLKVSSNRGTEVMVTLK